MEYAELYQARRITDLEDTKCLTAIAKYQVSGHMKDHPTLPRLYDFPSTTLGSMISLEISLDEDDATQA